MTRDELIAALEAATGPDLGLSFHIAFHEGWTRSDSYRWVRPDGSELAADHWPPNYTASIDAALTLAPEGWTWMASNRAAAPRAGRAYIHNGEMIHGGTGHMTRNPLYRGVECTAATPAIALCIAALRARP